MVVDMFTVVYLLVGIMSAVTEVCVYSFDGSKERCSVGILFGQVCYA